MHIYVETLTTCACTSQATNAMRRVNKRGEPMLSSLNLTSHLHHDGVFY